MQIIRDTNFDFMKYRKFWLAFSFVVMGLGAVAVFFLGKLNMGIDFVGGSQLTVKFREQPDVQQLRALLEAAGIADSQIQRYGAETEREVMIRTPIVEGTEEGSSARVLAALDQRFNSGTASFDVNQVGRATLAQTLAAENPAGVANPVEHYAAIAESVLALRKQRGIFVSWEEIASVPGLATIDAEALKRSGRVGEFALLSSENVGAQVGSELRKRGLLAVVGALVGMLLYIWIRFELRFGVGATMASLHDVLITLGLYAMMGYEFNLTTIAAFLTLVGYSVNDTVVTFDRVRENMRKHRSGSLVTVLNRSLNQMLSRTLLTGGTTILASMMLWLFGGEVIKGFAFIMMVGIVVGTYSSIYIASPFALLWEQWFGARKAARKA